MSQYSNELQLFKHKGNFKEMPSEEGERNSLYDRKEWDFLSENAEKKRKLPNGFDMKL